MGCWILTLIVLRWKIIVGHHKFVFLSFSQTLRAPSCMRHDFVLIVCGLRSSVHLATEKMGQDGMH